MNKKSERGRYQTIGLFAEYMLLRGVLLVLCCSAYFSLCKGHFAMVAINMSSLFTTFFLWSSLQFALSNIWKENITEHPCLKKKDKKKKEKKKDLGSIRSRLCWKKNVRPFYCTYQLSSPLLFQARLSFIQEKICFACEIKINGESV